MNVVTLEELMKKPVGYINGATAMSSNVGGGGGSTTGGWNGKKKDDDDEEWARRCARQAVKMSKPWKLSRYKGRRR